MAFDENQSISRGTDRTDRTDGAGLPKNMTPNWAKVAADLDSPPSVLPPRDDLAEPLPGRPASRRPDATALASNLGKRADKSTDKSVGSSVGGDSVGSSIGSNLDMVLDIPVQLSVELGRTKLPIKQILELKPGSVVELDSVSGEPIDVLVNGYLVAQGEIVVVNGKFGIRLTDVVTPSERFKRFAKT